VVIGSPCLGNWMHGDSITTQNSAYLRRAALARLHTGLDDDGSAAAATPAQSTALPHSTHPWE
jgi:hypothetical protein